MSATSPGEPEDVRFDGDDGRSGAVSIAFRTPVELTWSAGANDDDAVYVDLAGTSAAPATRCLFTDGGHATLAASAFGTLDEGTIAVHRVHREAFHARGVNPGEVRFDFARVVSFIRR